MKPGSKDYPILQLERFRKEEKADGIHKEAPVALVGAAVLQLDFTTQDGRRGPRKWVRFKIFEAGMTDWPGLIMCAKTLDRPKYGGLGLQVKDESYGFSSMPEVELPRLEAHFAGKKDGGVLDVLSQARNVAETMRRTAGKRRIGSGAGRGGARRQVAGAKLWCRPRVSGFGRRG